MLFLFPALLYWESLSMSLREIRRNLRGIILASTVLVIATAAAVAAAAHALGMPGRRHGRWERPSRRPMRRR
jgi:NhaP-type Na+/H+ or K+/H+ antiporter